jgi:DNA polymerase-3 subunit gamma/tau
VAAASFGNITYESTIQNLNILDNKYFDRLLDAFKKEDVSEALLIYKEIREKGFDSLFFINGLAQYIRDLMVARNPQTVVLLEAAADVRQSMSELAAGLEPSFFYRAMSILNNADLNFRSASNKQFLVELTLIKLCQILSPSTTAMTPRGN